MLREKTWNTSRIISSPKVKLTAFVPSQKARLLSEATVSFVCKHHVTEPAPSHSGSAPRWHMLCAALSLSVGQQCEAGSADEPQGTQGSCLLNPLTCQPISCQASANGWPVYDLQGHKGFSLTGSSLIRSRDSPTLTDSVPAGPSQ